MLPRPYARGLLALICVVAVYGFVLQAQITSSAVQIAHDNGSLLRLHVLANSDSPADQQLKLAVRDALIPLFGELATNGEDAQAVEAAVRTGTQQIVDRAQSVIRAHGKDYPVRVEIGDFEFPQKSTVDLTLPAGEYRAVRVLIGAAAGRNWWCVLFPPMCFAKQTQAVSAVAVASSKQSGKLPVQMRMRYLPRIAQNLYAQKAVKFLQSSIASLATMNAVEAHGRIPAKLAKRTR